MTIQEKFEILKTKKVVRILAIESSCDETSVAIVENGRKVLALTTATQIDIHKRFGGVVPEVASRNHICAISSVCQDCIEKSGITLKDIDAVAVTYGAGLLGALLVGVNFAKGLAYALDIPLLKVSHITGHIASNYITYKDLNPPFVCLMVSGGHTAIIEMKTHTQYNLIGASVDDAVGEAFDKVARVMGLEYPGGVKIDQLAKSGEANISFTHKGILAGTYNFSFSGIKTAVINYVHNLQQKNMLLDKANISASFQKAVVDELVKKTISAVKNFEYNKLVVAGGVSANSQLRKDLAESCEKNGIQLFMPELSLCTDNAAMIGASAYFNLLEGCGLADNTLTASSVVKI